MPLPVFIPTAYESRYKLLGAMAAEFGQAFTRAGAEVNPTRSFPVGHPTLHLFFNFPQDFQQFINWVQPRRPGAVFIQFFVDHPFALNSSLIDQLVCFPNYRLLLPCIDDRSLLQLRWPALNAVTCQHAVDPSALCREDSISGRDACISVAGTIASLPALEKLRTELPEPVREPCMLAAEQLASAPQISPLQAFDLFMPAGLRAGNHWQLLQLCTQYIVAAANRSRRLSLVHALSGLPVHVYGNDAWRDECTGSIEYRGGLDYAELPGMLASSRIAVAWNPTQFTQSLSERVLLCMGAGCATITDDRPMVGQQFGDEMLVQYVGDEPASLRACAEELLKDADRCMHLGMRGRAEIQRAHLWDHRTELIGRVVQSVLTAAQESTPKPS